MLADKVFGFQRSILIGGSILTLGYLSLAMPHEILFYAGLSLLILGQGLFKPNISSIVGTLYAKNDPKRESGFTIFYLGINIGSLIPPLFLGPLTDKFGWNSGFLVAMFGLLISLLTFTIGRKYLKKRGEIPKNSILLRL
ncbi:MAG: MFS transporter [Gammaproteobacteria bacterium]|nr:MFS transporter [Gammaproteobacteria bacterium]